MENIVNVQIGQSLPPDRWREAADHLEEAFPLMANILLQINGDGMGKEDAQEFMNDAQLSLIALRYVAEFASENCRFIPVEGLGLK